MIDSSADDTATRALWARFCVLCACVPLACTSTDGSDDAEVPVAGSSANSSGGQIATEPNQSAPGAPLTNPTPSSEASPSSSSPGPSIAQSTGAGGAGGNGSAGPEGEIGSAGVGGNGSSAAAGDDASGGADANPTGSAGASGGTGGGADVEPMGESNDIVTRSESTFTFQHFPIETNGDDVWSGAMNPGQEPTTTTYDTIVLENGYLRVTLLPDYGGRVLSIVHKPTDRELLYQNPIGTPYLMYEDIFYYDYLVIMGGIFPSFPEPEHGRYWNQPYAFEVVSETDQAITVRMSRQDDRDIAEGVPEVYDVGRTDVLVEVEVTLRAGRANLELDTRLTNTRDSALSAFEYWTVTTLAPGSPPGETAIPLNTRIIAAMERVHLLESSWSWFGDAEERVSDEVFIWNNLSYFENWVDQGTGFANPSYQAKWSGLINYDNDMGILRVSENTETPGLKLWTFGRGSLDIDINDSNEWLRPTIEMWHGVTPEFWDRGSMAANEVREWSESYFPTIGLREVTAASEYGAVHLSSSNSGTDTVLSATATLTVPDQSVTAVLRLGGNVIAEQNVVVTSAGASLVDVTVASSDIAPGTVFEAEFLQDGNTLLTGQTALQ